MVPCSKDSQAFYWFRPFVNKNSVKVVFKFDVLCFSNLDIAFLSSNCNHRLFYVRADTIGLLTHSEQSSNIMIDILIRDKF